MKTGLVLEGGGMKCLYTCGVFDVLLENNIITDVLVGVSAGASFGCNYKSRQIGRVMRYVEKFRRKWNFASMRSFLLTGDYFNAKFLYDTIPNKLDVFDSKAFSESKTEMHVCVLDVETGELIYKKLEKGDAKDILWMRASSSVPLLSKCVKIDGRKYLDGGMACSIPFEKAVELGCEKTLVIYSKPEGVVKTDSRFAPYVRVMYKKHKKFVEVFANCDKEYLREIEVINENVKNGKAMVIRPSKNLHARGGEKDVELLKELYQLGRQDALNQLDAIKSFFECQ